MNERYSIEEFDPLVATDQELFKIFDLLDVLFRETEKDEPLPTQEFRLKAFRHKSTEVENHWWLIKNKDEVIGYGVIYFRVKTSPSYEQNKHVASFQIKLRPEYRREGIGSTVLKKMMKLVKEKDVVTVLQANVELESGYNFCEKLNGIIALEGAENRCYLKEVDWDLMKEWNQQGHLRKQKDGRYLQWFEKCPEDIIEEYTALYTNLLNQQPLGELELRANITPEKRRESESNVEEYNRTWHTVISRESNGTISALTDITYSEERGYRIEQQLTGVKEEYRGKGLGKWLKSEMVLFIKEKYPDVKFISTGNADSNAAMLSINTRMGFKEHSHHRNYKFTVPELEKRMLELEKM